MDFNSTSMLGFIAGIKLDKGYNSIHDFFIYVLNYYFIEG